MLVIGSFLMIFTNFTGNYVVSDYIDKPEELMNLYNANMEKIPSMVSSLLGDERIIIHLTRDSGVLEEYSVITENGKMIYLEKINLAGYSYSLEVTTTEKVINNILASDSVLDSVQSAIDDGSLKIDSLSGLGIGVGIAKALA